MDCDLDLGCRFGGVLAEIGCCPRHNRPSAAAWWPWRRGKVIIPGGISAGATLLPPPPSRTSRRRDNACRPLPEHFPALLIIGLMPIRLAQLHTTSCRWSVRVAREVGSGHGPNTRARTTCRAC
jgi:hypothetical protein